MTFDEALNALPEMVATDDIDPDHAQDMFDWLLYTDEDSDGR